MTLALHSFATSRQFTSDDTPMDETKNFCDAVVPCDVLTLAVGTCNVCESIEAEIRMRVSSGASTAFSNSQGFGMNRGLAVAFRQVSMYRRRVAYFVTWWCLAGASPPSPTSTFQHGRRA
jgi:hypothetical protein